MNIAWRKLEGQNQGDVWRLPTFVPSGALIARRWPARSDEQTTGSGEHEGFHERPDVALPNQAALRR